MPDMGVERPELLAHREQRLRVADCRRDLHAIAHNPRIAEQARDIVLAVTGDFLEVEGVERPAVVLALVEDGVPAEARLGALEDEHLEEMAVVVRGHAPLFVVVAEHEVTGPRVPGTADGCSVIALGLRWNQEALVEDAASTGSARTGK